jgi:DtxR family Mn-dependent transcriptional regulator
MIDISPIIALSIFALFVLIVIGVFFPKVGLFARYKKISRNTKRVQLEDALKHLYDYEQSGLNSTLNSIAGNLNISVEKASKIVDNLKKIKLVSLSDQSISLSEEGKNYALRIVRVHRLWENYLAEETGFKELDWHDEAEKVEHFMSLEEADRLAAQMGNPKFDPHGDPIPSTDGEIFNPKSKLLNNAKAGEVAKITHIEDEPKSIYTKLLNKGLHPGKEVLVIEKNDDNILIATDGEEKIIAPLSASKVSVEILENKDFENIKEKTLIDLKPGETGEVISVSPTCRGQQRRRLLDFGIVPGTSIAIHMNSPLRDPVAYLVKDTIVALRKEQANKVVIKVQ